MITRLQPIAGSFITVFCLLILVASVSAQWKPTGGPIARPITDIEFFGDSVFATSAYLYNMHPSSDHWLPVGFTSVTFFQGIEAWGDTLYGFALGSQPGRTAMMSVDGGTQWSFISGFPDIGRITAVERLRSGLYFGGAGGVARSLNREATWEYANEGLGAQARSILAFDEVGDATLVGTQAGIYYTDDAGSPWTRANGGPPATAPFHSFATLDSVVLAASTTEVYRSIDGGRNWTLQITGLPPGDTIKALLASGGKLYAATDTNGVYSSGDHGLTWSATGLDTVSVTALAGRDGLLFAGTTNMGVYRSSNEGATWERVENGIAAADAVEGLAVSNGVLYAATHVGPYISHDGGDTWRESRALQMQNPNANNAFLPTPTPDGALVVIQISGDSTAVYQSSGENWQRLPVALRRRGRPQQNMLDLMYHQGRIYALDSLGVLRYDTTKWTVVVPGFLPWLAMAAIDGYIFTAAERGVVRSLGNLGEDVINGLPAELNPSLMRAVGSRLYMLGDNYLYRTDDLGESWTRSARRLGNLIPTDMIFDNDTIYVSAKSFNEMRVMRTTDFGDTWQNVSQGLERLHAISDFLSLAINDRILYLGTYRTGVWKRPLAEMSGGTTHAPETFSPEAFSATVAPNPASSSVSILLDPRAGSRVGIELYDQLGRSVLMFPAGRAGQVDLDIRSLSPGIYRCVVRGENGSVTRSLVVVR